MLLLPWLVHLYMNCIQLLRETFEWLKIDLCLTDIFFYIVVDYKLQGLLKGILKYSMEILKS